MAYEPIDKIGERRGSPGGGAPVASPFGADRFDRLAARPVKEGSGDWLTLSGAARTRMEAWTGTVAADTAHLGVHGRDLARIARGEISYESWLQDHA